MTPERKRALLRVLLHGVVGWVAFVVALIFVFPYDRVKDRVIGFVGQVGYDMDVGEAGPAFGLGMRLDDITLRSRPVPPAKATRIVIDSARITLSPFALLRGASQMTLSADALGGQIVYTRRATKTDVELTSKIGGVSVGDLPGVADKLTVPVAGTLDLSFDLTLPGGKLGESSGSIDIAVAGLAVGDGKAKLKVAGNPLLAEGLTVPRIRLGDLAGTVEVEKGKGDVQLSGKSPDGEIKLDGELTLRDPVSQSSFRLYLQFKVTDKLRKSAEQIDLLLQLGESAGKRSDGFYGVVLSGRLDHMDPPLWAKTSPLPPVAGARASSRRTSPKRASASPSRVASASPSPPAAGPLNIAPATPLPASPAPTPEPAPSPAPSLPPPPTTLPPAVSAAAAPVGILEDPLRGTPPPSSPPSIEPSRHTIPVPSPSEPPARPDEAAKAADEADEAQ